MFTITVFAIISVILCLFNYNPFQIGIVQFIYFFLSVLFGLWGIITIILFGLKIRLSHKETIYIHFWPAARQGLILALGLTFILILQGLKLLDIWVGIPIMVIIILLEMFFQTKKHSAK